MRLETQLQHAFNELEVKEDDVTSIRVFLYTLQMKSQPTYEHCVRVGLLVRRIGQFMGVDEKALFYAGLLHDVGKCLTDPRTLSKTDSWTPEDSKEMESHVSDGFRLLRGKFDFSAQILAWHHQFQAHIYPNDLPPSLHAFSKGTEVTISLYGRVLAIADTYDALHRVNFQDDKVRKLSNYEIKEKMLQNNLDQLVLVKNLYKARILES